MNMQLTRTIKIKLDIPIEIIKPTMAEARGILVNCVDARYTSQKCSSCGYISRSNRQSQAVFKCKHCNFSLNADLNASRNIRQNYLDAISYPSRAAVNQPVVGSRIYSPDLQATGL
jgi:transposase